MSQIPSSVTSIAQAQLTQAQQAKQKDAAREAGERQAGRQQRLRNDSREFVEDMAEATGLKVDPDGHNATQENPDRQSGQGDQDEQAASPSAPDGQDARAHAAALLSSPDGKEGPAPPPCMIDIEA